jgi:hypothetical protein
MIGTELQAVLQEYMVCKGSLPMARSKGATCSIYSIYPFNPGISFQSAARNGMNQLSDQNPEIF